MNDIPTIASNLRTQDNRITANPIFMVQVKVLERGDADNDDPHYWVDDDWDRVDDKVGELLDEAEEWGHDTFIHPDDVNDDDEGCREIGMRNVDDYTKVYYREVYQHHQPFFTEHGANEYLKVNAHNLREPRIYVEGGYRNEEWSMIREHLAKMEGMESPP